MKQIAAVVVLDDLFGISERLREIDSGYFIMRRQKCLELHHEKSGRRDGGGMGSFCLSLPFEALDARTVDYVRKTRAERAAAVIAEMDAVNEKLRREQLKQGTEQLMDCFAQGGLL